MTQKQIETAKRYLEKCNGDCKHCKQFHPYFADTLHTLYMAYGCDLLPQNEYSFIADRLTGNNSLYENVKDIISEEA